MDNGKIAPRKITGGNSTRAARSTIVITDVRNESTMSVPKTQLVASISNEVRKDQQAVSDTYSACLRLCKPDDESCKNSCDAKANASAASKRMLRCEQMAADFK